jgi:pectinesterase
MRKLLLTILFFLQMIFSYAQKRIVVDANGKGDFKTIQGAINSLSDSAIESRIIFIKKGIYKEKIYVEKHNIILQGEQKETTVITNAIAREEWRCAHNDDWGVATINIDGNDITLKNITVINSYGLNNKTNRTILCALDTTELKSKIIKPTVHQMALRTMAGTRLAAINCIFKAYGGDTVSPWNVEDGLFYFKNCEMEGGVDFYCPRGWAYAEGCTFTAQSGDASVWHDGSKIKDAKTVLKNCLFKGYDGFNLGRYHRDAQFFLIDCSFAKNMANKDIFLVPTNNKIQWGRRVYYYNCHKQGGDYTWFADNLAEAADKIEAKNINTRWVFGNKWNTLKN